MISSVRWALIPSLLLAAASCGTDGPASVEDDASSSSSGSGQGGGQATSSTTTTTGGNQGGGSAGTGGSGGSMGEPCPAGVTCVTTFPFSDSRDTSQEGTSNFNVYDCSTADESGPEIVYRLDIPSDGFLSVAVYDDAGADIDVHILGSLDAMDCLDRGDLQARADVEAGYLWVVADTYVNGSGEQSGNFDIDIGFVEPSMGSCAMDSGVMPRVGDGGNSLAMPATGPMVLEAHLVTDAEPSPYPSTPTAELAAHYALSQAETGFVMYRDQVWAPLEGGDHYGAGIGSPTDFPVEHEGWYVNMYWTAAARPDKGDRMILRDPVDTSRAVVVAAGYETGPGNLEHIGGTTEETHHYMGTGHLDELTLGIATDQSLPLGPRVCTD